MSVSDQPDWPKRISLALLAAYWTTLFVATHVPIMQPHLPLRHPDKWLHAGAYAALAVLMALAWSARATFAWRGFLIVLAILVLYGAVDEITQIPVGRHGDVADWQADVVGSIGGLAVFLAARTVLRRVA